MSATLGNNIMVPILLNFCGEPVGHLIIRRDALPPTPTFTFGIGFKVLQAGPGDVITKYELVAVSPVSDDNFVAYLERK